MVKIEVFQEESHCIQRNRSLMFLVNWLDGKLGPLGKKHPLIETRLSEGSWLPFRSWMIRIGKEFGLFRFGLLSFLVGVSLVELHKKRRMGFWFHLQRRSLINPLVSVFGDSLKGERFL